MKDDLSDEVKDPISRFKRVCSDKFSRKSVRLKFELFVVVATLRLHGSSFSFLKRLHYERIDDLFA